jgi:hypothetical protein
VPSPRAHRGRDFQAPAPVVYDSEKRVAADPARSPEQHSLGKVRAGFREVRNGLPFRPYVYRGTGTDQMENADA